MGTWHEEGMRTLVSTLAVCALGLLPAVAGLAPRQLRLAVLDVGQGDALLILTPRGRSVLIDGGPDGRVLSGLGAYLDPARPIDLLVLTHPHADHLAGLVPTMERWPVRRVMLSGALVDSTGVRNFLKTAATMPITFVSFPQIFTLDGVTIEVLGPNALHPGKMTVRPNDDSVVLRVTYGASRMLLTGDLEVAGEAALIRRVPDLGAEIYKAGHHGSRTSSTERLLDAVRPRWVPISVGLHNVYRHPSPEVLERANGLGITTARTDEEGTLLYACTEECCRRVPGWKAPLVVFSWEHGCGTME